MRHYFILAAAILVALSSCTNTDRATYRKAQGQVWGTYYNITYRADRPLDDSIKAVMAQVDASLSMFNPSSTVSRVNRGEDVVVDSLFVTVFNTAAEVSRLTGGRFDPTVGTVVNLWGFGYKAGAEAPTQEQIATALATVGIASCRLHDGRVVKKAQKTEFDFSAIAKGYGCDLVAYMLERNGCHDYMIEIGGEMALKGVNSRGEKWHVQIDAPVEDRGGSHEQAAVIEVTDCGIATSGNYRNYRDTPRGERVSHTISPLTGLPVRTDLLSVTVIAPDAMWADALATACMVCGLDDAQKLINSLPGVEALFISAAPASSPTPFTLTRTPAFPLP